MDQTSGLSKSTLGNTLPARASRAGDDRSIEEIRHDIEQKRSEITTTVDRLGERLKETVDWRHYISEYPVVAVGGAALIGFYLTRKLLTPKRSSTEEIIHNLINSARDAITPKKTPFYMTILTLAGKYALDEYHKYQEEQVQQQQLEQQLRAIQLHQQMLGEQVSETNERLDDRPAGQFRTAGRDF